jgi:hypothetical protein
MVILVSPFGIRRLAKNDASILETKIQTKDAHIAQSDYGEWRSIVGARPITTWVDNMQTASSYAIRDIDRGQFAHDILVFVNTGEYVSPFIVTTTDGTRVATIGGNNFGIPAIPEEDLPIELYSTLRKSHLTTDRDNITFVVTNPNFYPTPNTVASSTKLSHTIGGMPILVIPENSQYPDGSLADTIGHTYALQLPFGGLLFLYPDASWKITPTWSIGDATTTQYEAPAHHLSDLADCFLNTTPSNLADSLIQTGTDSRGEAIYEVNPAQHEKIYQCFYKLTSHSACICKADNTHCGVSKTPYSRTFPQFLTSHAVVFMHDSLGDLWFYKHHDLEQPDGKGCGDNG